MKQHDDVIRKALSVSPILGKRIKGFYFVVFLLLGLLLPFVTISNASNEDWLASGRYGQYVITAASAPNVYRQIDYMTSDSQTISATALYLSGGIKVQGFPVLPKAYELKEALQSLDCVDSVLVRTSAFDDKTARLSFIRAAVNVHCVGWDLEAASDFYKDKRVYIVPEGLPARGVLLAKGVFDLICEANKQIGRGIEIGDMLHISFKLDGDTELSADVPFAGVIEGRLSDSLTATSYDSGDADIPLAVMDTVSFAELFTIPATLSSASIELIDIDLDNPLVMPGDKVISPAPNSLLIRLRRGAGLKASGMKIQKVIDAVLSPAETDSVRLLAASDFSSSELKDLLDRSYVITVGFCVLALVLFFQVINIAVLRVAYLKADPALRCFYLLGSRNLEIKLKANLFAMRLLCRRGMMGLAFGLPLGLAAVSFLVYLPVSILLSVLYGIAALVLSASVHFVASKAILSDLGFASELGRAR